MSEQAEEQTGEPGETQPEPDTPLHEPEPDAEPDPDAEPEPEPEPDQTADDKVDEVVYGKLDTKADNYFKGVRNLLDGASIPVTICELCADAYPGLRWIEPRDDLHKTLLGVIGATEGESPLLEDPDAVQCDRCGGLGWTKLPAFVPGNTERVCGKCNGAGWLDTNPASGVLQPPVPNAANGSPELMPGVPENDPSVVDLRARGFTVIPPMQIAGATEPPTP